MNRDAIAALFDDDGALAAAIPGFAPRPAQREMAGLVADAFASGESLIVEAGTGTGKTFAYLAPALLSGQRVVISTGTKNLQDQLFQRDLPRVKAALGSGAKLSLLKGRSNYLCLHRLAKAQMDVRARPWWPRLAELGDWSRRSGSGEISEIPGSAPDEALAARITSTADNCLGSKCPDFNDCFVVRARRAAAAADVVVVNHALLFADHLLRQEGFSVMPGADAVVIDEAHQLPELALRSFGVRVSTQQLHALTRDVATELDLYGDLPDLAQRNAGLAEATHRLEGLFAQHPQRLRSLEFRRLPGAEETLCAITEWLDEVMVALKPLEERSPELGALLERALRLVENWGTVTEANDPQTAAPESDDDFSPTAEAPPSHPAKPVYVRWVEPIGRGGALNATPLDVSKAFGQMRAAHKGAWVFTSATLAAGADFRHFSMPLGLGFLPTRQLQSPFDYRQQARLWLPPGLPDPNDPAYNGALAQAIVPLIAASGGGAFVLCTSHRALQQLAGLLRALLPKLPVMVQGEAGKNELLKRFAEHGGAVLVATASFWEGVDVRGKALRLVIIDKLPFAAPGDPVLDAKHEAIRAAGRQPFSEDQLPRAIVALRQGAGRLIRDISDQGLLVLADPRLKSKPYGQRVLKSLPPMPLLKTQAEALDWLHRISATDTRLPA